MSFTGGIVEGIQGKIAYDEAMAEIKKLPDYKDQKPVSELLSLYTDLKGLSKNPFSADSNGAFDAMLGQSSANAYQRGVSADPSLSGAIMTGMNTAGLQQSAQRALSGDQLRANYIAQLGGVANTFQGLADSNVIGFNTRLNQREVALGNAASTARANAEQGWVDMTDQAESYVAQYFGMSSEPSTGKQNASQTQQINMGGNSGGGGGSGQSPPNQNGGYYDPNQNFDNWANYGNGGSSGGSGGMGGILSSFGGGGGGYG
jgi:hypothetical protein